MAMEQTPGRGRSQRPHRRMAENVSAQCSLWSVDRVAYAKTTRSLPFDDRLKQAHRIKGNYILATSAWYPNTTTEKLFVLTKFLYWFFLWDDGKSKDEIGPSKC